tara:strand:+ start:24 stop:470 length:447 start_codon:yes stop_codon:yes gene_type:complete
LKIISKNKKATFNYFVLEKFRAGIVLVGSEIKAIREGKVNINEGFLRFFSDELFIVGMHIGNYSNQGYSNHENDRKRKILLHKKELLKISKKVESKGITMVPIQLFFDRNLVKIEFGLAKGKKQYDKRKSIKDRDIKKNINISIRKKI